MGETEKRPDERERDGREQEKGGEIDGAVVGGRQHSKKHRAGKKGVDPGEERCPARSKGSNSGVALGTPNPRIFFWVGQMTNQTLNHMMVAKSMPIKSTRPGQ
jgi:hypothetical protein